MDYKTFVAVQTRLQDLDEFGEWGSKATDPDMDVNDLIFDLEVARGEIDALLDILTKEVEDAPEDKDAV